MASLVLGRLRSAYSLLNWRPWLGCTVHCPNTCSSSPGYAEGSVPTMFTSSPSCVSMRRTV